MNSVEGRKSVVKFKYNGVPGPILTSKADPKGRFEPETANFKNLLESKSQPLIFNSPTDQLVKLQSKIKDDYRFGKVERGNQPNIEKQKLKAQELKTHRYEVQDIPDAKEEDFRSGCCGRSPVTYEAEQKKRAFC